MNCMNCGAKLTDSLYCPVCGTDVTVQKQAVILSGLYYNQGLEKAQVRDLSGAAAELMRSLKFNKLNIPARNLLGLVYFELGEVVAALSEWVVSENLQPEGNLASYYIADLRKDANRLDVINETIKKFNIALGNAKNGNEDMAVIQLRKILAQNPKLIKAYHLLGLLYIKQEKYDRAEKLLRKALGIDRTNTTTLRFLMEVEEQRGKKNAGERRVRRRVLKEETENRLPVVRIGAGVLAGLLLGIAVAAFIITPARARRQSRQNNEQITAYTAEMATMNAEITSLNERIEQQKETVATAEDNVTAADKRAATYEQLSTAVRAYYAQNTDGAATALAEVDPSVLSEDATQTYMMIYYEVYETLFGKLKQKGLTALNRTDYETAVQALERAKEIDGTDEEVLLALTEAQTRLAAAQRAAREAEKAAAQAVPPVIPAESGGEDGFAQGSYEPASGGDAESAQEAEPAAENSTPETETQEGEGNE